MNELIPTAEMTVSEVLERWPDTALVFNRYRTACVGCAMAAFDTIDDVARIYHLDLEQFLQALQDVAGDEHHSQSAPDIRG